MKFCITNLDRYFSFALCFCILLSKFHKSGYAKTFHVVLLSLSLHEIFLSNAWISLSFYLICMSISLPMTNLDPKRAVPFHFHSTSFFPNNWIFARFLLLIFNICITFVITISYWFEIKTVFLGFLIFWQFWFFNLLTLRDFIFKVKQGHLIRGGNFQKMYYWNSSKSEIDKNLSTSSIADRFDFDVMFKMVQKWMKLSFFLVIYNET